MATFTFEIRWLGVSMIRFDQLTWRFSARLVALACWALAITLTGNMGWHAWTSLQDSRVSLSSYRHETVDTALGAPWVSLETERPIVKKR